MDPEELEPQKKLTQKPDLEVMGLDELDAYLEELAAEGERVRAAIAAKRDYRGAAETFFKR